MTCEQHTQTWASCAACAQVSTPIGLLPAHNDLLQGTQVASERLVKPSIAGSNPAPAARHWPDPTPEMLDDARFNSIWQCIKSWDINVPAAYAGYMGATGNHARAILDALRAGAVQRDPGQRGWVCPRCRTVWAPFVRACECRP